MIAPSIVRAELLPSAKKLCLGINRLDADIPDHAKLPRQCADDVVRRVKRYADNAHALFPVWNAHPSDDIATIFVKQGIELLLSLIHILMLFFS